VGLILQFLESATLTASTPSPATVTVNTGLPGPQGPAGDAATIDVASTTTLAPGSAATVTNVGTTSAASLAFGIPRGDVGPTGSQGPVGPVGPAGVGIAAGGTTGQVLGKTSNADYATGWVNLPSLAGYATESWVNSQGFLTSSSLTGYATESWVTGQGYITASALSPYLLSATAAATYLTQSNAASTYATQTALASYLTTAVASATYQTLAGMSSYLTTATAATTYAPIAAGVPTGGTTGQVLAKSSNANYALTWATPTAAATWGSITGTLSAQTDLNTALGLKSPIASPTFTGTVTIPAGASIAGYLTTASAATTYAPIAAAVPTGGSTGQVLTKSSATNYALTWATPTIGDRYSTTSTSLAFVSNGTKTFTVAAGLSYTPLQDVTIAYTAEPDSFHMHARVVSYSGTTLVVDVTQHTGSGGFTSWTVNVGGISSIATWGQITGTLSAQTDLDSALAAKLDSATAATTYAPIAPNDGNYYIQRNGVWELVNIF